MQKKKPNRIIILSMISISLVVGALLTISFYAANDENDANIQSWTIGCVNVQGMLKKSDSKPRTDSNLSFIAVVRLEPTPDCIDDNFPMASSVVTGFGLDTNNIAASVNMYDFRMQDQFWLNLPNRAIKPTNYIMEKTFNMDNGKTFVVQFALNPDQLNQIKLNNKLVLNFDIPLHSYGVAQLTWPYKIFKEIVS